MHPRRLVALAVMGLVAAPLPGCKEDPTDGMVSHAGYRFVLPPGWSSKYVSDPKAERILFENGKLPDVLSCNITILRGKISQTELLRRLKESLNGGEGAALSARTSLGPCVGERFSTKPEGLQTDLLPAAAACSVEDGPILISFLSITAAPPLAAVSVRPVAASGCEAILASIRNTSRL